MTDTSRRNVVGLAAAVGSTAVLVAAMLPFRTHLSVATTALVLVVPVVVGVASGAFVAGAVSVFLGFFVYDLLFIPPYLTLDVGAAENWVALGVYAAVMLPVARVVAGMNAARAQARERGEQIRRLFDMSTQLVEDHSLDQLLPAVAADVLDIVNGRQVALLVPRSGRPEIVASAGRSLTPDDRRRLEDVADRLADLDTSDAGEDPFALALVAAGRPIGTLTVSGAVITASEREALQLFGNQVALAVERAELRDQAVIADVSREIDRLARTLVASVSHDLRAPLASIKAASSTLVDPELRTNLNSTTATDLLELIDGQADRLAALVTNLLDMSRVQAGVLELRTTATQVAELVDTVVAALPDQEGRRPPSVELAEGLPLVDADTVLVCRVLSNLLENAYRYAPKGSTVELTAEHTAPSEVTISVMDRGPGVHIDHRSQLFGMFTRRVDDTGTGLGLAIAKTYVDAHHQRIWVEDTPGGGATFRFTLATAAPVAHTN